MKSLRPTVLILLTAATCVGLVAGCSDKDPGRPTPQSTTGSAGETTSGSKSTEPSAPDLDFSKFTEKPCDLLKSDQLGQLGTFKAAKADKDSFGPNCRWAAQDVLKGAAYTVTLLTNGSTIEDIAESSKGVPVYRQTKVAERPAVSSDATDGKGNCTTAVGTSSKAAILVQISIENEAAPEYKDSCGATEKVAALVIQNLKG